MSMQPLLVFLTLAALFSGACADSKPVLHIFLVGGQSNAVGQDSAANGPEEIRQPQDHIPFYYQVYPRKGDPVPEPVYTTLRPGASPKDNAFGPELSCGPLIAAHHERTRPGDKVAIIKYARGGTNLYSQWKPNGNDSTQGDGPVYRAFQTVVHAGLKALAEDPALVDFDHRIEAMLWVQGEADLSHDHARDYAENLATFIQDVRATFGKDLAFYFTRISDNQTYFSQSEDAEKVANFHLIREQQAEVGETVEDATMIDIDPPEFSMLEQQHYSPHYLHFDANGTTAIGEAFAQAYLKDRNAPPAE